MDKRNEAESLQTMNFMLIKSRIRYLSAEVELLHANMSLSVGHRIGETRRLRTTRILESQDAVYEKHGIPKASVGLNEHLQHHYLEARGIISAILVWGEGE